MAKGDDPHAIKLRQRVALMRELGVAEWDPQSGRIVLGKEPAAENPIVPATDDVDDVEVRRRHYSQLLHRDVSREEVERHLP